MTEQGLRTADIDPRPIAAHHASSLLNMAAANARYVGPSPLAEEELINDSHLRMAVDDVQHVRPAVEPGVGVRLVGVDGLVGGVVAHGALCATYQHRIPVHEAPPGQALQAGSQKL